MTAPVSGLIVRAENGVVMLDLDGDGREQSGWVIMFLHIGEEGESKLAKQLRPATPSVIHHAKAGVQPELTFTSRENLTVSGFRRIAASHLC